MCVCAGFFLAFVAEQQPKSEHTKDKVAQILHHSSAGRRGGVWGRGIVCLCRILETCMPAGRKAKGAKMKAFYALLQPQESDRVDND